MSKPHNHFDSAIYVRVKRHHHTFFVLCDEYEEIGAFKNRLLPIFEQAQIVKHEEPLTVEDLKLYHKNRVILKTVTIKNFND